MRFYATTHKHSWDIDLHARNMYVCILSQENNLLLHRKRSQPPEPVGRVNPATARARRSRFHRLSPGRVGLQSRSDH
jgi:hypothetical protein